MGGGAAYSNRAGPWWRNGRQHLEPCQIYSDALISLGVSYSVESVKELLLLMLPMFPRADAAALLLCVKQVLLIKTGDQFALQLREEE